jgi:hypothetical protein
MNYVLKIPYDLQIDSIGLKDIIRFVGHKVDKSVKDKSNVKCRFYLDNKYDYYLDRGIRYFSKKTGASKTGIRSVLYAKSKDSHINQNQKKSNYIWFFHKKYAKIYHEIIKKIISYYYSTKNNEEKEKIIKIFVETCNRENQRESYCSDCFIPQQKALLGITKETNKVDSQKIKTLLAEINKDDFPVLQGGCK